MVKPCSMTFLWKLVVCDTRWGSRIRVYRPGRAPDVAVQQGVLDYKKRNGRLQSVLYFHIYKCPRSTIQGRWIQGNKSQILTQKCSFSTHGLIIKTTCIWRASSTQTAFLFVLSTNIYYRENGVLASYIDVQLWFCSRFSNFVILPLTVAKSTRFCPWSTVKTGANSRWPGAKTRWLCYS